MERIGSIFTNRIPDSQFPVSHFHGDQVFGIADPIVRGTANIEAHR